MRRREASSPCSPAKRTRRRALPMWRGTKRSRKPPLTPVRAWATVAHRRPSICSTTVRPGSDVELPPAMSRPRTLTGCPARTWRERVRTRSALIAGSPRGADALNPGGSKPARGVTGGAGTYMYKTSLCSAYGVSCRAHARRSCSSSTHQPGVTATAAADSPPPAPVRQAGSGFPDRRLPGGDSAESNNCSRA